MNPENNQQTPQTTFTPTNVTPSPDTTPPPVTPSEPIAPKKSFLSKLKKPALLIPLAVVIVLGAGSAAAYFGYVVPNNPQNLLAKSLQNTLAQHQATTQGTVNLTSSGVSGKATYIAQIDSDAHAVDVNLKTTVSGADIPVELMSSGGNLYVKVGDLSTVEGLIGAFAGGDASTIKPLEDKINSAVTNKWFVVDSTLIKEAKLDCLANYPTPFSQADIQALSNSYKQKPFVTIKSRISEAVNGAAAYKYQLSIDDNTLAGYNLANTNYFKNLSSCLNQGKKTDLNLSSFKDGDKTPITVWVDKKTKLIVKYASQSTAQDKTKGTTGDLTGTISYGKVSIKAPANAKPVLSLVSDLGLGDFVNGFTSGFNPTTSAANDTERKTDIKALQGHLEVYFAENGYYPTLASLNNPTWRATNMKGLDPDAFKDPAGSSDKLTAAPTEGSYSYAVVPATCDNGTHGNCNSYTLTATLDDGSHYTQSSVD